MKTLDPEKRVDLLRDKCLDELQKLNPADRRVAANDLLRELQDEIARIEDESDDAPVLDCGSYKEE